MELEKYGMASSSALNSWVLGGKTGLEWVDRGLGGKTGVEGASIQMKKKGCLSLQSLIRIQLTV